MPSPDTVVAQKKFPFLLNCSAYSPPQYRPINYTWYKNGQPLALDRRVQVVDNGSLYFQSIKRRKRKFKTNDEGFYECLLTNSVGTVIARRVNLKIASKYDYSFCPQLFVKAGDIKTHSSVCPSIFHKNFNLAHIFWSIYDRTFIFGVHDPCDKPFLLVPCGDVEFDLCPMLRSSNCL